MRTGCFVGHGYDEPGGRRLEEQAAVAVPDLEIPEGENALLARRPGLDLDRLPHGRIAVDPDMVAGKDPCQALGLEVEDGDLEEGGMFPGDVLEEVEEERQAGLPVEIDVERVNRKAFREGLVHGSGPSAPTPVPGAAALATSSRTWTTFMSSP